ncbi:MAG: hypothetical protein HC923_03625 [Myxococcales bacterium]|nr:hypothetical protein [Myxococcales bacterium]
MKSPEWWISWYHQRREDSGAQAIDLVSSRGWIYNKVCGAQLPHAKVCRSTRRVSTKEGFYVCAQCGGLWPFHERFSFKGEVQTTPRADHFENSIARLVDVGCAYARLLEMPGWKWKARMFIAHALGWSYSELETDGPVAWPDAPPDIFTPWKIRNAIHSARRQWQRLLSEIGIPTRA